jgi:protoheme ferro-lyase
MVTSIEISNTQYDANMLIRTPYYNSVSSLWSEDQTLLYSVHGIPQRVTRLPS